VSHDEIKNYIEPLLPKGCDLTVRKAGTDLIQIGITKDGKWRGTYISTEEITKAKLRYSASIVMESLGGKLKKEDEE
jgi:hypothetical protein